MKLLRFCHIFSSQNSFGQIWLRDYSYRLGCVNPLKRIYSIIQYYLDRLDCIKLIKQILIQAKFILIDFFCVILLDIISFNDIDFFDDFSWLINNIFLITKTPHVRLDWMKLLSVSLIFLLYQFWLRETLKLIRKRVKL